VALGWYVSPFQGLKNAPFFRMRPRKSQNRINFNPKGVKHTSPGQRPGFDIKINSKKAKKGRILKKGVYFYAAKQYFLFLALKGRYIPAQGNARQRPG
ncbi:hypothetical protein MHK_006603, partial [Candidatus Magnetomorum sp. HK-1]